jgi:hypothetical protein
LHHCIIPSINSIHPAVIDHITIERGRVGKC